MMLTVILVMNIIYFELTQPGGDGDVGFGAIVLPPLYVMYTATCLLHQISALNKQRKIEQAQYMPIKLVKSALLCLIVPLFAITFLSMAMA